MKSTLQHEALHISPFYACTAMNGEMCKASCWRVLFIAGCLLHPEPHKPYVAWLPCWLSSVHNACLSTSTRTPLICPLPHSAWLTTFRARVR
eukprot:48103-Eustigmatos_ZCMA.PRE.1